MTTKEIYTLTPSIGGSFSYAWNKMFSKFLILLIVIIIAGIIQGPFQGTWKADSFHFWMVPLVMFGVAWGLLIASVVRYGEILMFLKAMREEELDIKDLFSGFSSISFKVSIS